jgi:hypothetical protein
MSVFNKVNLNSVDITFDACQQDWQAPKRAGLWACK